MKARDCWAKAASLLFALSIAFAALFALSGCTVNISIGGGSSGGTSSGSAATAAMDDAGSAGYEARETATGKTLDESPDVEEDGEYSDKEHVALYIHEFGHLPSNYISKTKAKKAGWVSTKGNLWDVLPGMSIGGSEFYNDEGALPDAKGRRWTECDIDYGGGYRNEKRIVFSNDGLVFYTGDHYKTFEQLY